MHLNNFTNFNQAQLQAVTAPDGHLLINAAAGTGKTTTIASRILYLQLEREIPYDSILAISFSRSAKSQLTTKLEHLISITGMGSQVASFTFHGLAYRILRIASEQGETWLKPGFKLQIDGSSSSIFQEHASKLCSGLTDDWALVQRSQIYLKAINIVRQGHADIGGACLRPKDLQLGLRLKIPHEHYKVEVSTDNIRKVWERYIRLLRGLNSIDYAGLISEALLVVREENQTRKRVCEGLRYLLVDEYQDVSRAQEQLMFAIAGNNVYLNVVGDDDQAIYTFNGSDVSNILEFTERAAKTGLEVLPPIHLTENYRSSSKIIHAANRVLHAIRGSQAKTLRPADGELNGPIQEYRMNNRDISRVNAPRLELAASFVSQEIKRLIEEEQVPPSEIAVLIRKDTEHSPQGAVVTKSLAELGLETPPKPDPSTLLQALEVTQDLCQKYFTDELPVLLSNLKSGHYTTELKGVPLEQVVALLHDAQEFGAEHAGEAYEFLYDIEREDDQETALEEGHVQIRTVHSAKGQEFRVVFLMYIGERAFPHGARPDIDEEKRLYYVGITRAQERLYVIGKPSSQTKTDFFSLLEGAGVQDLDYAVTSKREIHATVGTPTDAGQLHAVDLARKRILEEEARKQDELKAIFEEDDF